MAVSANLQLNLPLSCAVLLLRFLYFGLNYDIISRVMSEKRLNNTIFLMYLATDAYIRRHNLSRMEFLALDSKFGIVKFISECPDIFDPMTEMEMADELDEFVAHAA